MRKSKLYILALTTALIMPLSSCKETIIYVTPDDIPNDDIKTPIELSVGGVDSPSSTTTRAEITDGKNKTMNPFDTDTKIFMIMQSEYDTNNPDFAGNKATKYTVTRGDVKKNDANNDGITVDFVGNNLKYWDDAHARSSMLTIWAYAQKGQRWTECSFPMITNGSLNIDDVSQGKFKTDGEIGWQTTQIYPAILSWSVGNPGPNQVANDIIGQDLLFSNNIANYVGNEKVPETSRTDRRLKFDFTTRKFPRENDTWNDGSKKTELKFYHAMSKITIQIKAGDGFKKDGTDFVLKNNTLDLLHDFNTKGLFNIKDGEFQTISNHDDITSIPCTKTANSQGNPYYTLEALAIPNIHEFRSSLKNENGVLLNLTDDYSRFVDGSSNVMMQITIDDNTYKITSDNLYDALMTRDGSGNITTTPVDKATRKTDNGNYVPLEAGKNYVFTFTIGKQKIDHITAKLADWENVTAEEQFPSNAYVNVSVKTNEGAQVTGSPTFALYRAPGTLYNGAATVDGYNNYADYNWEKGYEKSTSLAEKTSSSGVYTTEWYWPNNNTFYHFRTLTPTDLTLEGNAATTYVNIAGGTLIQVDETPASAKDYIWGAPFKTTSPTPDGYSFETGFCNNTTKSDGQLYKAIGATEKEITLIQHHMTSQVFVDLAYDETVAEENRVNLTGATVELVNIAQSAKLYLGNGLVTGHSIYGNVGMTADAHAAASPIPAYDYSYGVLPQSLSNNSGNNNGKVGVKITAADGNVYIINDLSAINESGKNKISEWIPGKKYFYKFTLKKTGIENLSATILDWETVTADDEPVQIK